MTNPRLLSPQLLPGEADFVRRAVAGEAAAFEMLMRRHNQLVFRTARRIGFVTKTDRPEPDHQSSAMDHGVG